MGRDDADHRLVIAAGKERVAYIQTLVFLPILVLQKAGDMVPLILAERIEIEARGAGRFHLDLRFAEAFDVGGMALEEREAFRVIRIERGFCRVVLMVADETVADLRTAMFDEIDFIFDAQPELNTALLEAATVDVIQYPRDEFRLPSS